MTTLSSSQQELEASRRQSTKKSVMREYLESNDPALKFEYPDGKNHYDFGARHQNLLLLNSKISGTSKASVYSYRRNADLPKPLTFKHNVIVKQIHGNNRKKSKTDAVKEVQVQKSLFHPHITAFLGTFTTHERLSIVIYPVAYGDLGKFMEDVCDDFRSENAPMPTSDSGPASHLPGELPIQKGHVRNNSRNSKEVQSITDNAVRGDSTGSFPWPLEERRQKLRRWFACLSAALKYLHDTGVRHKDIKPANIVIDSSGSALLTDFGISRLFPPGTEHDTNDQWLHTPEYASPEMMKGKHERRSDPSDVFSLGCVFVEMATVLLRNDLEEFSNFRSDFGAQEGHIKYYKSLPNVYKWISHGCARPEAPNKESPTNSAIFRVLPAIQDMLAETPKQRPLTKDLWGIFKDVSVDRCPDCDFRLEDTRWRPSADQVRKTQEAFAHRPALLGAEISRAAQSRDSEGLPAGGLTPFHEAEYLPTRGVVDDDGSMSNASSRKVPKMLLHAPTASTDSQVPSSYPYDPLIQQIRQQQANDSATSSGLLDTVTPSLNDSAGSSSTASGNKRSLVYCVKKKSLRIEKINSIDPLRRKEWCLLPKGRIVVVSSTKGDLIATMDLSKIENERYFVFRWRRRVGHFTHVCVLFE